ncbi:serine hydrolase domain-containing protein [Limisalsivibrio acetivorans]|uniref:serine hydrolase domain-containing protein n=1 Tax=Limisalsivibrio acetivorans TaxID=1304888 RepID=UPI0003B37731|nr:serine hydrolase domain-containing protein [Limisalsivibrio acetivorans]
MHKNIIFVLFLSIFIFQTAFSAISGVDSIVKRGIEDNKFSGAVVLVSKDGKIAHLEGYGRSGRVNRPHYIVHRHIFDLASLTKVFSTTFAIMLLKDDGLIGLDDPVWWYIPEFEEGVKRNVTIRMLLTHTAGLAQWIPVYYHAEEPLGAKSYVSSYPLKWEPGAERHYSDLGFMLLGYIVEAVTGERIDNYIERELYKPLGLECTGYLPLERGLGPIVSTSFGNDFEYRMVSDDEFGYKCSEDPYSFRKWRIGEFTGIVNDANAGSAHGGVAGHAGLFGCAQDIDTMLRLLMTNGVHRGRVIIYKGTVGEFLTPDNNGHGHGWMMTGSSLKLRTAPAGVFGHTGFTGVSVFAVPECLLSVVILTNRQSAGLDENGFYPNINELRRDIADAALGLCKGVKQ